MKTKFAAAKDILTIEDSEIELSKRADEIDARVDGNLQKEITSALKKTMERDNIFSLSAPAIGYNKRIFCIKFKEEIKTFINPIIVKATGMELSREKCTSIPGREFIVPRNNDITVMYQRPMGTIETRQLVGLAAKIFQHEMQHLDGLILSDFALEIFDDWDDATEEERAEVVKEYIESLDIKEKELKSEIESNEETKKVSDAIDFIESVNTGNTKLEGYNPEG